MTLVDRPPSILVAASGFIHAPSSANNLGDRAQLSRTVERLRDAFPDSQIVAVANSVNDVGEIEGLQVSYSAAKYLTAPVRLPFLGERFTTTSSRVLRTVLLVASARRLGNGKDPLLLSESGRRALREMAESNALFISGAGGFNDLYMPSVAGFWGVLMRCMSHLRKPVIASGQQIGPLNRSTRRLFARWALRGVDLLGVRDPLSLTTAAELGIRSDRVVLTGDDAWDLAPAPSTRIQALFDEKGLPQEFIAAQVRFGPSVGWNEDDAATFGASLDQVSEELRLPIVFVPCMLSTGADDRHAAEQVREHLNVSNWSITEELDAATTKALLGKARLAIGTANHFCVFAASMGTSAIGIYASPYMEQKIVGLSELWPERIAAIAKLDALSPGGLVETADLLLRARCSRNGNATGDAPSREVQPHLPIQALGDMLGAPSGRPYAARFADFDAVQAYDQGFLEGRFMANVSLLESEVVRSTLDGLHSGDFKRHLDFACGTGRATGFVSDFVDTTVGVDISEAMLTQARQRFPSFVFVSGDVSENQALLEELGPFDLVTAWRFIAPLEPEFRSTALSAIARSMTDGGLLLLNNNANRTSLHSSAVRLKTLLRRRAGAHPRQKQADPSYRELCSALQEAGLQVEETRGICYLPAHLTSRLPARLWMPVERMLARLNFVPQVAVDQLLVARKVDMAKRSLGRLPRRVRSS